VENLNNVLRALASCYEGIFPQKHCTTLLFYFILFTNTLFAKLPDLRFQSVQLAQGLADAGSVLDIIQDDDGYLWFSTFTGVVKYDGYAFTTYLHNPLDSTSLSSNRIWAMCKDTKGDLWLASQYNGLNRYDPETESFQRFTPVPNDTTYRIPKDIEDIAANSDGLWIATRQGLYFFDHTTEKFTRFTHDPNDANSLSSDQLLTVKDLVFCVHGYMVFFMTATTRSGSVLFRVA
jgi:ligand-binding sensor domain-containing protein